MDREKKLFELIELFQAIVNKYASLEDMAVEFVNIKYPLFKSELHLIKCIKEHPERNVTGLASILGITKGAVSQTIGKLEKKKMIDRVKINGKEISLSLTAAGEKAYRAHEGFHANHFRELQRAMKGLTPVQIGFIEKIFKEIDAFYGVFKKRIHQR